MVTISNHLINFKVMDSRKGRGTPRTKMPKLKSDLYLSQRDGERTNQRALMCRHAHWQNNTEEEPDLPLAAAKLCYRVAK